MICQICYERPATQFHHIFSQTKTARKLYGKLIDHPSNLQAVCEDCHPKSKHRTEKEFCEILGIETRSKSGKL
jgi:5-methylcytosine-specific restriction endonuclease McrA